MKLTTTRLGKADLVKVVGEIDITTVDEVQEFFKPLDVSNLVIDLTDVSFMDTSGVHFLLQLLNRVSGEQGTMTLVVAPDSSVQLLIKLTGISDLFNIVESEDAVVG